MPVETLAAFIGASAILIAIPGPNVAMIVANSLAYGARYGLFTVAGTGSAMALQLIVVVAGFSGVLSVFSGFFEWFRWLGVAYLTLLAVKAFRAPSATVSAPLGPRDARRMVTRGFLVSLTNPKTLFFLGAFFPQFVTASGEISVMPQLTILACTFLTVAVVMDCGWALIAFRARHRLEAGGKTANRIAGSIFILAGTGLALARRS